MPESAEDDVYDGGALKVAIMVVSMLAVCTLVVIYSCYSICVADWKRRKLQQLSPNEIEPSPTYDVSNQTVQTSDSTTIQHSDYQLVFGNALLNNTTTTTTDVLSTSTVSQEMVRQQPLTDMQNEYERRAQERRENLERNADPVTISLSLENIGYLDYIANRSFSQITESERNDYNERSDIHEFLSVPPYNSQDDTLPSYDQAVSIQAANHSNKSD